MAKANSSKWSKGIADANDYSDPLASSGSVDLTWDGYDAALQNFINNTADDSDDSSVDSNATIVAVHEHELNQSSPFPKDLRPTVRPGKMWPNSTDVEQIALTPLISASDSSILPTSTLPTDFRRSEVGENSDSFPPPPPPIVSLPPTPRLQPSAGGATTSRTRLSTSSPISISPSPTQSAVLPTTEDLMIPTSRPTYGVRGADNGGARSRDYNIQDPDGGRRRSEEGMKMANDTVIAALHRCERDLAEADRNASAATEMTRELENRISRFQREIFMFKIVTAAMLVLSIITYILLVLYS